MHAVLARRHGYAVTQLEREPAGRGASVRNFGLVWVSGRRAGPELALALRARELWEEIAEAAPGTGFRPAGSLTIATSEAELAVMREAVALPDAKQREFELLTADEVRSVNPALRGEFLGGLLLPGRRDRRAPGRAARAAGVPGRAAPIRVAARGRGRRTGARTGCATSRAAGTGATSWCSAPGRTSPGWPGRT